MAFSLKDVRYTTRKGAGGIASLHPRLVRDRTLLPQIDITIQHFESMLGRERREIDLEVLVHFFGDPKLARCVVASLAHSYRFRAHELPEVVSPRAERRLRRAGITSPQHLRLALFDRLNQVAAGFLPSQDRVAHLAELEGRWLLRAGQLDRLVLLDQDEHAVLERSGAMPRPADIAAQYNLDLLVCLLRHAEAVELELRDTGSATGKVVERLAADFAVDASHHRVGPNMVVRLSGRQDALGAWSRHGRRTAHLVLALLERFGSAAVGGAAVVHLRERRTLLRLTPELLAFLGAGQADPDWHTEAEAFGQADLEDVLQRARGSETGWLVQRLPEPRAWQSGVLLPDLSIRLGRRARAYLQVVRSTDHGRRLAPIAMGATSGDPFLFLGPPDAVAPLADAGLSTLTTVPSAPADLRAALAGLAPPAARAA